MSARPAAGWWIRAGARAYGPFASERLPGFVREGRLTPATSVARDEAGPWLPAGRDPSLDELFAPPASPKGPPPRAVAPPASAEPAPPADPAPGAAHARAFVVFAELPAGREAAFAEALGRLAQTARARPGVWLARAAGDAAQLRNALSQALVEGESLMVVEADAADAAWFNLGGEADRALRALWSAPVAAQSAGRSSRA